MRNEICKHCKYKRAFCWFFRCDPYYEAQMKRTERRLYKRFLEDFDAEDRYAASLIIGWTLIAVILLMLVFCGVKVIGEWL